MTSENCKGPSLPGLPLSSGGLLVLFGAPWLVDAAPPPLPTSSPGMSVSVPKFPGSHPGGWVRGPPYSTECVLIPSTPTLHFPNTVTFGGTGGQDLGVWISGRRGSTPVRSIRKIPLRFPP